MSALVIDASAMVDYLRATPLGVGVAARLHAETDRSLHVPQLCGVEVANAVRGLVLGRKLKAEAGGLLLADFAVVDADRHDVEPFLPRIWALRDNLNAYDAAYVALAEALDATLVTTDAKLAPAYRHHAEVEVIA